MTKINNMKKKLRRYCKFNCSIFTFINNLGFFLCSLFVGASISMFSKYFFYGSSSTFLTNECIQDEKEPFVAIKADENRYPNNSDGTLVLIGIMTAQMFIDTRALAAYETWAQSVPGKVAIFAKEDAVVTNDIPVIRLSGTDDAYPPQKKSFMMLKYMHDHFLYNFEFFMRVDDDVYIRTGRLAKFLNSLNSSKASFIGQPGLGTPEELGLLSLVNGENFCMGGPGIIISQEALVRIGPHISDCLQTLHTYHEDVEVGRCVQKFAEIPCTWSYEMRHILYNMNNTNEIFTSEVRRLDSERAITVHPFKNHLDVYKFHHYMNGLTLQEHEYELTCLARELGDIQSVVRIMLPLLDAPHAGVFMSHLADKPTLNPCRSLGESGVVPYSLLVKQEFDTHLSNPQHWVLPAYNISTEDMALFILRKLNGKSHERGREFELLSRQYSYYKTIPGVSLQHVMDLKLLYKHFRGNKSTSAVRRRYYTQVPFGPLYMRERIPRGLGVNSTANLGGVPATDATKINFLLPLSGRLDIFKRFMECYERVVLKRDETATLTIAHYARNESGHEVLQSPHGLVKNYTMRYPAAVIQIVEGSGSFSRAPALNLAAQQHPPSSLLFCLDVDLIFDDNILPKIRMSTIRGQQVYFPIVFGEFHPATVPGTPAVSSDQRISLTEDNGVFRHHGYGIMAMYKSDLDAVGGFNTTIIGWGGEDVDIVEKLLRDPRLTIFRSSEPSLIHVYHTPACFNSIKEDVDSSWQDAQAVMCAGVIHGTHGSLKSLARKLYQDNRLALRNATAPLSTDNSTQT